MSFGGPIDSMINAYKANNRLLKKNRRLKELQSEFKVRKSKPVEIKESNFEEMSRFRSRLKREKRRDRHRFILIWGLTIIIIMVILLWVVTADYSGVIELMD